MGSSSESEQLDASKTCNRRRSDLVASKLLHEDPTCSLNEASEIVARPVDYDVFISHRGPDVKKTFVDILNKLLKAKGIATFVDYSGLEKGDHSWPVIKKAVRNAKLFVVVLSRGYAESIWCLQELNLIMENDKCKILPVFFDVPPSEVRSTAGPYAAALSEHLSRAGSDRHSKRRVERWRERLEQVSLIMGFRLDEADGYHAELADQVVSSVEKLLEDANPLCVPKELESSQQFRRRCEDAEQRLDMSNVKSVVILGVYGKAGKGKSSLAKRLFNRLRSNFETSCILLHVREKARSPGGLERLLQKLMKDLLKLDRYEVDDVDQCRGVLNERISRIRCLIIIDDISSLKQQQCLLIAKEFLAPGSRVIVTSRYQQVLRWDQIDASLSIEPTDNQDLSDLSLRYHGLDVIKKFVDHLRESFITRGLTVSVEDDSDPVEGSAFSVNPVVPKTKHVFVIVSKEYVKSQRCLSMLPNILDTDAKIVPIFYNTKRDDIANFIERQLTGSGYSTESVDAWKHALQQIISVDVHFSVDFDELSRPGNKVKDIVIDAVNLLDHDTARFVADYPVGLIERSQDLERFLKITESRVMKVGVVGMGGIGKTTLVKSLYNGLHKKFEGACILLDVRAKAQTLDGLPELQSQIIKAVLGEDVKPSSVGEGQVLLSKRLAATNVLLVLDDVDDRKQVDALVSTIRLGPGGRIVLTSRAGDVLLHAGISESEMYRMDGLTASNAQTLFYWHAFLRPYAPSTLNDIAQQLIDACQGLPLSLEVIGSDMYDVDDIDQWKEALQKMRNSNSEIFQTLRISFDKLNSDEKMAFLDVACFLIGEDGRTARRFWEGCGTTGHTNLHTLIRKSLVKVNPGDGKITMHDQLRDMGRLIVGDQSERPWNRSHVWNDDDARKILEKRQGTDNVRGLKWMLKRTESMPESSETFDAAAIQGLCELRLLFLSGIHFVGALGSFSEEIRWLQWHRCGLEYLPPELRLPELAVLDLSKSFYLRRLWNHSMSDREAPKKLKELNLSRCYSLEQLPQFDTDRVAKPGP